MIPTPDVKDIVSEIERLAKDATPGPWFSDGFKSEGTYGTGDDTHEGFNSYAVYSENKMYFGKPAAICEASGDSAEIHEEFDEDSHSAWDEVGRRNMAYIAAVSPDRILALTSRLKTAEAENERLTADCETLFNKHLHAQRCLKTAEAENVELRRAVVTLLEPFAVAGEGRASLTPGHLRAARDFVNRMKADV